MGTDAPAFLLDRKWPLRIAVGGWLAVGLGAWFLAGYLDRPAQVVLAGLWLVGLGLLLRQFIVSLFGPVLAYDVLRVGRKPRQIWFRVAYAAFLAFLFTWVYMAWLSATPNVGAYAPRQAMARMAETYFYVYAIVQFIMVCFLTPASVAGAIADEKERRTLEFLLATDLTDREILFGKLASRVGALLVFLMAGVPILGMLQFFGGIDPDLVLAAFAATVVVVLSLSALGIAASVLSRRARDAIALTYLVGIAYVVLSILVWVLFNAPPLRWTVEVFGYAISSEDISYPIVAGNPFFMVPDVMRKRAFGAVDLFEALGHFTLFHAVVIAALVTWAGYKLRPIALKQTFGSTKPSVLRRLLLGRPRGESSAARRPRARRPLVKVNRPAVGDSPVVWKEVFVDSGLKLGGFARVLVIGLVAASLTPVALIFYFTIIDHSGWSNKTPWQDFGEGVNVYLRIAGTMIGCLLFLAVTIRGSACISGERDRHTLDALLTTPLAARSIVWGKWWGCVLGFRLGWAWLFGLWVFAMAVGGVHPVMFPAAVLSVAVYASAYAWLGIFCSLHCRTTLRATMTAILAAVFLSGGYFLVFVFCCVIPMGFTGGRARDFDVLVDLLSGFSPAVNMAWLPIHEFKTHEMTLSNREIPYAPFWILGLIGWGLLSVVLSRKSVAKFREMANRGWKSEPRRRAIVPPPLPKRRPAVPGRP
ncbi:MAG TPA: ABC transporter permease [Gemmataceae bacterium]|nr:ABC transporter permease [Gemmataceae bacterium]